MSTTHRLLHLALCICAVPVAAQTAPPPAPPQPAAAPAPAAPAASASAPRPAPCSAAAHRQFDFWIGHWEVFGPAGRKAGENRIAPILGGCVLQEDWSGTGNLNGRSLNLYDRDSGRWHQSWVDSSGGRLELSGGLDERGRMVMSQRAPDPKRPGAALLQRITWSRNDDGSVRQLWESSGDDGASWSTIFDGRYVRRAP